MSLFDKQVEELVLLRCSLLPQEILEFSFSEDLATWTKSVDAGCEGEYASEVPNCPAEFIIKLQDTPLWFEIQLSNEYPSEPSAFQVSIRGHDISRATQQYWDDLVQQKRSQLDGVTFPVFELISGHLFPLLHSKFDQHSESEDRPSSQSSVTSVPLSYSHALLTSHHLISPQKRKSLLRWSSELKLNGFAKIGYPGIIYCSGIQASVTEFVTRVKGMQWLALRVRFEELLPHQHSGETSQGSWLELQKVGEVVEEMKNRGHESALLNIGIKCGRR